MKPTVARAPHVRRAGLGITLASLASIAYATLLPNDGPAVGSHFCLVCGALGGVNAFLNVFLFVPLGIGLALAEVPAKRAVVAMCVLSALIEAAQFSLIRGRDSTIGDLLTNTLGGALGFAIAHYAERWLVPSSRVARNLAVGWATIWLAIQIISSFGFALSLPKTQYYGQIAREFWNFAVFPGRVLSASIDGLQIPNTLLANSGEARRLLLEGATAAATVVPAELTSELAPVVRIADRSKREIVLLAQNGDYLVFGVHTGADVLRLRPVLYGLHGAFPAIQSTPARAADTLSLSGRYDSREVRMIAQSRAVTIDRRIPVNASMGWSLLLPFQWFIEGTRSELVMGWLWLACLAIPFGYWSARTKDSSRSQEILIQWAPLAVASVALLCGGLIVAPITFGRSAAPLGDWLATVAGALAGAIVSAAANKPVRRPEAHGDAPED